VYKSGGRRNEARQQRLEWKVDRSRSLPKHPRGVRSPQKHLVAAHNLSSSRIQKSIHTPPTDYRILTINSSNCTTVSTSTLTRPTAKRFPFAKRNAMSAAEMAVSNTGTHLSKVLSHLFLARPFAIYSVSLSTLEISA
jgi:hypothetical protein